MRDEWPMLPRERTPRSLSHPSAAVERHTPTPPRDAPSRSVHCGGRGRWVVGCALGWWLTSTGCTPSQLPHASLVYRHERDSRHRDHRVELWLTRSPRERQASLALDLEPVLETYDPCPGVPFCDARDRLIDEAERRYSWIDPRLEEEAADLRFDDVMPVFDSPETP
jgi:hypothetical protein